MEASSLAGSQQKVDASLIQSFNEQTDLNSPSFGAVSSPVFSADGSQETISSRSSAPFNISNMSEQKILYRACEIVNYTILCYL